MQIDEKAMMLEYIRLALKEDIGDGDHTSLACVPASARDKAVLIAKEGGVIAGLEVAEMVYHEVDPDIVFEPLVEEGQEVAMGDHVFSVEGSSRSILTAERLSLNYIQRMSGIATHTRRLVRLIGRSKTVLLDTRKTTPNMRIFEKYAVRVGGGYNHRYNLSDGVLLKDNHIGAAGSVARAVKMAKEYAPFVRKIEVEVENLDMVREALEAGADIIMLDNMSPDEMREAVRIIDGRAQTECSGNVTKENIARLTELGVDYISSGALTHSASILDISMKNLHSV